MLKILVTGATGFIGNYVVEELLEHPVEVIASSSSATKAKNFPWFPQVIYKELDFERFEDSRDYWEFFNKPDIMIHLAWEGLPNYKSAFHIEKNMPLHLAFLQNLVKRGLNDFTITGTCFEYGMREGALSEEMPADPANFYAIAKDQLRKSLEALKQQYDFKLKWVRLFYMYGKGQHPNSLLSQLDKALEEGKAEFNMSGGEQIRDYMPVEKVAENIVKIALQHKVTGIINCSTAEPVTIKKLVEDYLRKKNKTIKLNIGYYPYPDYEPMAFWGDNSKLKLIQ